MTEALLDALGDEITIGKRYGVSITTYCTVIGVVQRMGAKKVTLIVEQRLQHVYVPPKKFVCSGVVFVLPHKMFPVS